MEHTEQNLIALGTEEISALEDSRHFVNRSVEALNLQFGRLEKYTFKNADDFWHYLADAHFYIVALKRLRQALLVSKKFPKVWHKFEGEFTVFDKNVSDAVKMRNILEHIDDYVRNAGRNGSVENSSLYAYYFDVGGCLHWGGLKFDRYKLHANAENIVKKYRQVINDEFKLYQERKVL